MLIKQEFGDKEEYNRRHSVDMCSRNINMMMGLFKAQG